jgi:peptide/nickel transport system ATP-binding protein
MSADEPVVSMDDATVQFESEQLFGLAKSQVVRAVDGVSLDIRENEVVALVGESGCGKTTLGKAAIGLHRPESGTVSYRGTDIWEAKDASGLFGGSVDGYPFHEIRRSLQMIHQDAESSLDANSTIQSVLEEPLIRWEPQLSRPDRRDRVGAFLDYVGLSPPDEYIDRFPHQLSGGEQQRVALIRALLMNPDMILADESISALDVSLRIDMMDLMLRLQDEINTSYLFITHDISNARYITKKSDGRIGIMYLGNLVEIGPVEEVITNPQHPYTKALLWATPDIASSGGRIGAEGIEAAPLRAIDVPDAANPPSGCKFHDRCPEAREVCEEVQPDSYQVDGDHETACFRMLDDHEYWSSPELEGEMGDQLATPD